MAEPPAAAIAECSVTSALSVDAVTPAPPVRSGPVALTAASVVPAPPAASTAAALGALATATSTIARLQRANNTLRVKVHRLKAKLGSSVPSTVEPACSLTKAQLVSGLTEYLSAPAVEFIAAQLKQCDRKPRGYRWEPRDKSLALSVFHASPKAYSILGRLFLLPTVRTLRKSLQHLHIHPGFSPQLLDAFKIKVAAMSTEDKLCAVIFDEMAIKECVTYDAERDQIEGYEDFGSMGRSKYVANHALVFMVRGLVGKWKQPIGYFLSSGTMTNVTLVTLLKQAIDKAHDVGLKVKVVICDQGSNNRYIILINHSQTIFNVFYKEFIIYTLTFFCRSALQTSLGVKMDQPFFDHNGDKIFCLYDPPHLLKNVRNNFKKHGFLVTPTPPPEEAAAGESVHEAEAEEDDESAKVLWRYVEQFFAKDSALPIRMAPKLSRKHLDLPGFTKMRVKFAAQVLSHSVAAGISTMCHLGCFDAFALTTAEFIDNIDQLFNCFNSKSLTSQQKFGHALSPGSDHFAFLDECHDWLQRLKSLGKRKLPCIEGWMGAIHCLKLLWDDLHSHHGLKFLLTDRLNQDCAENLFSVIRGKGGHRDNPDARCFRASLRQVMVERIMVPSPRANCQEDVDAFLFNINAPNKSTTASVFEVPPPPADPEIPESVRSLMAVFTIEQTMSVEEENILTYIAGYVSRKVSLKVCDECRESLHGTYNALDQAHCFLHEKQYDGTKKGGLVVPSKDLFQVCTEAETIYRKNCEQMLHMSGVRMRLVNVINKGLGPYFMCNSGCATLKMVVSLFVNIRLHHSLKDNNCEFASSVGKKNRKLLKLKHV